jgi:hypothetical protein
MGCHGLSWAVMGCHGLSWAVMARYRCTCAALCRAAFHAAACRAVPCRAVLCRAVLSRALPCCACCAAPQRGTQHGQQVAERHGRQAAHRGREHQHQPDLRERGGGAGIVLRCKWIAMAGVSIGRSIERVRSWVLCATAGGERDTERTGKRKRAVHTTWQHPHQPDPILRPRWPSGR